MTAAKKRPSISGALNRAAVETEPATKKPGAPPRIEVKTTATFTPDQHRRIRVWMAERDGVTLRAVLAALVDELTAPDSTTAGLSEAVERRLWDTSS